MPLLDQNNRREKADAPMLGFIGLGYMGSRIAKRLLNAGHRVVVFNRHPAKAEALSGQGAQVAATIGELAANADIIFSCLADGKAVRSVYLSEGGVLAYAKPGTIVIEMSTVAPDTSTELSEVGRECEVSVLDVAISGSTPAAEAGALTLFGGGTREVFETVTPLFPAIAKQWFYMGRSGSGVAMKLVVNTLLGVGMEAIAEAVALGGRLGLERRLLFDTLAHTAVVAPAQIGKLASAQNNDYSPQFPARLMQKDFLLITSEAASLGVAMPATVEASRVLSAEILSHQEEEDFSAVIRALARMADAHDEIPNATYKLASE
jgi:3-hydroxyisobutyrate dehydrogenase-like beta-hydroxyacid dehydrogenase